MSQKQKEDRIHCAFSIMVGASNKKALCLANVEYNRRIW